MKRCIGTEQFFYDRIERILCKIAHMIRRSFAFLVLISAFACIPPGCTPPTNRAVLTSMAAPVTTEPWTGAGATGKRLESRRYDIYTTTTSRSLVENFPGFMEAAYENYIHLTGLADKSAGRRLPIYLMRSRQEWAALTKSVFGGGESLPLLSIQSGGYCFRGICVLWDIGPLATFSIAAHEGLHQFFHHQLADKLPAWLEEGLCTLAEGYRLDGHFVAFTPSDNTFRFTDLRMALVQNHWLPLEQLLGMHSMQALQSQRQPATGYYGQLWGLILFIRSDERYRAGLERLIADASAGRLYKGIQLNSQGRGEHNRNVSVAIFRKYIHPDPGKFEQEYRRYAMKLARLE